MSIPVKTIQELNRLSEHEFVEFISPAFERTPALSKHTYDSTLGANKPVQTVDQLVKIMWDFVDNNMTEEQKKEMVRSHPELQSKKRREQEQKGDISVESKVEHKKAGLDLSTLTSDQLERFDNYNERYSEKFGFPFIVCVRYVPNKALGLLEAFEKRIDNDKDQEFRTAIEELKKIGEARIKDRLTE
jgi:2-oxo-4-hydroxy-4-carboxy-5-ureidoimidazoline decarboxylase